jgi:Mlc titration factor MtfA (ptsG expression regulator)
VGEAGAGAVLIGTRRHRMRRDRYAAGFLPEWRDLLARRMHHWNLLDADERELLEEIALELIAEKSWEAARGFDLTDEIMVMISSQAALIALGLPADCYRDVQAIVVHPTTLVLTGPRQTVPGVVSDGPMPILGQASFNGPVLIAWDTVVQEARHPGNGHNVVFHEFAHKLDMLDGTVDGTPPLASREEHDRWVEVCTQAYLKVVVGQGGRTLRSYAGVNPGEFFAVATEVFFDDPLGLQEEHPDLYEVLGGFYRQDPAARVA